jgi:glycosyltransferase involved in cell wall biosynthesis
MSEPTFVMISSARDEAEHIGNLIQSVARQSVLPAKWIIVDDGSRDATADIVRDHAAKLPWLQLAARQKPKNRSFQSQYSSIMEAYDGLKHMAFDVVSKADTDLVFEDPSYFETLFAEMRRNPRLGITGGWVHDTDGREFKNRPGNRPYAVAGGIQTFRRECFEQIGGYHPLRYGGSDTLAEIMAREAGWDVYAIPSLRVLHCRPTGGFDGAFHSAWRWGKRDASFGGSLPFCALKYANRIRWHPVLVGPFISLAAFLWFRIRREPLAIPSGTAQYVRREQRERLLRLFKSWPAARSVGGPAPARSGPCAK